MSQYTETEHEWILQETLYWEHRTPVTIDELYRYGCYFWRIKDMENALEMFLKCLKLGYEEAAYDIARVLTVLNRLGADAGKPEEYYALYRKMCQEKETLSPKMMGRLAVCLLRKSKDQQEEKRALGYLQKAAMRKEPDALFWLGKAYARGELGMPKDWEKAHTLLKAAYDLHCEEAVFMDFYSFPGSFGEYPCQREIKEAYSFKLGQYMRLAEQGVPYAKRAVAAMYQNGYPGDAGEKNEQYLKKAEPFLK